MKYHAMAKHFLFECGAQGVPDADGMQWFNPTGKPLTNWEFTRFVDALDKETIRQRETLITQSVIES